MSAGSPKNRVRCHSVLNLDTGLRLAMAFIIPLVSTLSAQGQVMACNEVFSTTARNDLAPYYDIALDRALTKSVREFSDYDGLSVKDLQYLVEKVYTQQEGKAFKVTDYFTMTSEQRTFQALSRMVGERVTHQGLVALFKEQGILLDNSTLISKIRTLNRADLTNISSAAIVTATLMRGRYPIFLPEFYLKVKTEDMTVLLLRGLESKEGREILKKYHSSQEQHRAYELFNRYYTRVALAVVFAILVDKGDDFFKEKHDDLLADLWTRLTQEISGQKGSL